MAVRGISDVLNLLTPWIVFGFVTFLLLRVQRWVYRHLFGVSYLASRDKTLATLFYLLALFPGVFLREFSRYMVSGMVRVPPAFFTPIPQAGDDGIVDVRFFHFFTLNPVYAALIGAAPFLAGLAAIALIGNGVLGIPAILAAIGSPVPNAFRDAFLKMISRPDFLIWVYVLFGIANTMMPMPGEVRASWFIWVIVALFLGFLAVIGLYNAILTLLAGPVTQILYGLSTVFGVVLVMDLFAAGVIAGTEAILGRLTNQRIEYQPAQPARKQLAGPSAEPHTIFDVKLPVPPPVSKGLPVPIPSTSPRLPTPTQPGLPPPARKTGELPPVPEKAPPPPPEPAKPLPGAPPPRIPAGAPAATADEEQVTRKVEPARPAFGTVPPLKTETQSVPAASAASGPSAASTEPKPAEPPKTRTGEVKPPPLTPAARLPAKEPEKQPEKPISGPPAIARPTPPPAPGGDPARKTGLPIPAFGSKIARPAPKPGARPAEARSPSNIDENDFIEADVIEEVDENQAAPESGAKFPSIGGKKDSSGDKDGEKDNDEVKYVGLDEA